MFWPGSEAVIGGRQATYWTPFDDDMPHAERVNRVLDWLRLPEGERPSFLTLYFSDVDSAGHSRGPDSEEVKDAVMRVDKSIGDLVAGVQAAGLDRSRPLRRGQRSRHGGAQPRADDRARRLRRRGRRRRRGLVAGAGADAEGRRRREALRGAEGQASGPGRLSQPRDSAEYGLAGHPRLPPIFGVAKEGWNIASKRDIVRWGEPDRHAPGGTHGYDTPLQSMQGLFIATGPRIRAGLRVKPFENIHLYEFMCAVLGLQPAKNDGDPAVTRDMLRLIDDRKFGSHHRRRLEDRSSRQPRRHPRVLRLRHLRRLRAGHRATRCFPATDPLVSLIVSFATFAVGYLARPIGGIVLSHYGDRYGRRACSCGRCSSCRARRSAWAWCRPTRRWGVAASLLMVTLRLIQGFCLGGELPGALTYVVETAPRIAPFVCGVVFACVTMGVAVATGVSLSVRTFLDPALVPAYGWRIAFILGGLGGVLSFVLRRSLEESPEFERMRSLASRQPFRELLQTHLDARCWSAARCSPAPAASTACSSRTCRRISSGVLQYDPAAGGAVADGRRDRVRARHPRSPAGWAIAFRRAISCAPASGCCWCSRYPFYGALETRAMNLTLLCALAGAQRGPDQRILRGAADRSLPDARPFHRRRARLQCQLHDLQRHRAAGRDDVDSRHRAGDLAGLHDDGQRRARAGRQPVGRSLRRQRAGAPPIR